ncbi:MAG: diguanylate cyclase [bacterium]
MAEFEYNLLIVHNDRNAQESLIRLFDGKAPDESEAPSAVVRRREFVGRIEFTSGENNEKVSRKLYIRTADSVLDYQIHWEKHHQDAVLLSLFLPEDDRAIPSKRAGLKLLKRIKRVDPEAEVIVLTDQIFQDESIEAIDCGAFYFIPQPQIQGIFVKTLVSQIIKGREVRYISNLDGLTGLYNRQFFDIMLKREIDAFGVRVGEQEQRQRKHLSLMMIDVDKFKEFNDKYRHVEGDRALRFIADKLGATFRKSDIVARVGGDEFAVILPATSHGESIQLAERVRKNVKNEPFLLKEMEEKVNLTVSVGVATYPEPNPSLTSLYDHADKALMRGAKRAGGDGVYGYDDNETVRDMSNSSQDPDL